MDNAWALEGMADHLVSEAFYLSDPEGNGIEIYRDRPRSEWTYDGDKVRMANARIPVSELLALAADDEPGSGNWPKPVRGNCNCCPTTRSALPLIAVFAC